MKKLSREEAIKSCKDLWTFLAQNPKCPKFAYPPFLACISKGRHEELPLNGCYACEDAKVINRKEQVEPNCSKCFLLKLWKEGLTPLEAALVEELTGRRPCITFRDSPFQRWQNATSLEDKSRYAWKIADFCTKLLEEK